MAVRRSLAGLLPIVVMTTLGMAPVVTMAQGQMACLSLSGEQGVAACRQALAQDQAAPLYLRLGELLLEQYRFSEAIEVYEEGLKLHPDNNQLASQLSVARSGVDEWNWIPEVLRDVVGQAADRASLIQTANSPNKSLPERLEARNKLVDLVRRANSPGP